MITIDGRDLRTLAQESYRKLFGVVSQEALLFNATIRDNIAYGRDGLTEAESSARRASPTPTTSSRSSRRATTRSWATAASGSPAASASAWRSRAPSRASPPILILDEATSSLDSESERLVQQAIDRVIQGATSIVIAHRLSTVLHADKIVVLGRGGVEAVGRHADLLAGNETYAGSTGSSSPRRRPLGRL